MKNKSLAIAAALLLSAGIAFSFAKGNNCCAQKAQPNTAAASTEACCDESASCPLEACPLCCGK